MRSFLLSPFSRRLAICGLSSVLIVIAAYGILVLASIDDWRTREAQQVKWLTGQKERCEALFDRLQAEIETIDADGCSFDKGLQQYQACSIAARMRRAELMDMATSSDCPSFASGGGRLPLLLPPPEKSWSLPEYALERWGMHSPIIPAGMLALAALLLILSDMGRRLVLEAHVGWRRLSVVVAVAIPVGVFGLWLHDGEDPGDAFMAGLVTLAFVSVSVVYGRGVFLWVADGFGKPPNHSRMAEPGMSILTDTAVSTLAIPSKPESISLESLTPSMPEAETVAWRPATFRPRFWARCLDLPLCWVIGSIPGALIPDIRSTVGGMFGIVLDVFAGMVLICLAVFLYESFFVSRFGATPGKMLFGLQVRSVDDRMPTWAEAGSRGWSYLQSGLYFTLLPPALQILGAFMAWKRRDGSQPWDMAARTHVRQRPIGLFRFAFAVLVSFLLVSTMVVSNQLLKQVFKEEIRRSALR